MKNLKKAVIKLGEHIAFESVGKSCPLYLYEPKVPSALKEKADKDCK